MGQMDKGIRETEQESLKHHLWNGSVGPVEMVIDVPKLRLRGSRSARKKLLKAVQEFAVYIAASNEETITTAFIESTINQR